MWSRFFRTSYEILRFPGCVWTLIPVVGGRHPGMLVVDRGPETNCWAGERLLTQDNAKTRSRSTTEAADGWRNYRARRVCDRERYWRMSGIANRSTNVNNGTGHSSGGSVVAPTERLSGSTRVYSNGPEPSSPHSQYNVSIITSRFFYLYI